MSSHLLSYVPANQPVMPGFYAHSQTLDGTWHLPGQQCNTLATWKLVNISQERRKHFFFNIKLSKPRVISCASHEILKNFPSFSSCWSVVHFRKNFIIILIHYFFMEPKPKKPAVNNQLHSDALGNIFYVNGTMWKEINMIWRNRSYAITWCKWASPSVKAWTKLHLCSTLNSTTCSTYLYKVLTCKCSSNIIIIHRRPKKFFTLQQRSSCFTNISPQKQYCRVQTQLNLTKRE